MQEKLYNTTLALAGLIQAVSLVRELAQTGKMDDAAYSASIHSIFQLDSPTIPDVYGGIMGIKMGLEQLINVFDKSPAPIQTRYMLSVMHLQKKISRSPKILNTLSQRLQQTKKQAEYFSLTHPTVIGNLADIYLQLISSFKFRVIIWGNQRILTAHENMEKIRALLLAGIRSSVLWRQTGGSRLQLIFSRNKIQLAAKEILKQLNDQTNNTL